MANTYTQIHLQFVFAVKYRAALISEDWEEDLYKYITGITTQKGHKMLQINGMPDHLHMLVGFRTDETVSNFMKDIKGDSSRWVNKNGVIRSQFNWQNGYGAFSYSKWDVATIIRYIQRQKIHHQSVTLREEYVAILDQHEVDYDEKYLFDEVYSG